MCEALGLPELATGEAARRRYSVQSDTRAQLIAEVTDAFKTKPRDEWVDILVAADVPCAPCNTYLLRQTFVLTLSPFRSRDICAADIGTTRLQIRPLRWAGISLKMSTSSSLSIRCRRALSLCAGQGLARPPRCRLVWR